jgi:hypothetical protein
MRRDVQRLQLWMPLSGGDFVISGLVTCAAHRRPESFRARQVRGGVQQVGSPPMSACQRTCYKVCWRMRVKAYVEAAMVDATSDEFVGSGLSSCAAHRRPGRFSG